MKAKKKHTFFIINAGTYPFDIVCFFGQDKKILLSKIKYNLTQLEYKELEEYQIKKGYSNIFENGVSLLWMPNNPTTLNEMGQLTHETWHITDEIFKRIGVRLAEESTEAYAYLIQYLSVKIWEKLNISFTS